MMYNRSPPNVLLHSRGVSSRKTELTWLPIAYSPDNNDGTIWDCDDDTERINYTRWSDPELSGNTKHLSTDLVLSLPRRHKSLTYCCYSYFICRRKDINLIYVPGITIAGSALLYSTLLCKESAHKECVSSNPSLKIYNNRVVHRFLLLVAL